MMPTGATIYCGCSEGAYHCPDAYAILIPAFAHGKCPGCGQCYEVAGAGSAVAVRRYRPEGWASGEPHPFRVEWQYDHDA